MNCKSIILLIVVLLFWGNAEARKKKGKKVEEVQTESAYIIGKTKCERYKKRNAIIRV